MTISGGCEDVNQAHWKMMKITEECEKATKCAQTITWKYFDNCRNAFTNFPVRTNYTIELAFQVLHCCFVGRIS